MLKKKIGHYSETLTVKLGIFFVIWISHSINNSKTNYIISAQNVRYEELVIFLKINDVIWWCHNYAMSICSANLKLQFDVLIEKNEKTSTTLSCSGPIPETEKTGVQLWQGMRQQPTGDRWGDLGKNTLKW